MADRPVLLLGAGDSKDRVQHIALTDVERAYKSSIVAKTAQGKLLILLIHRQDRQVQQRPDSPSTLPPSGRRDLLLPVIIERDLALKEVKAVPSLRASKRELVPEAATQRDEVEPSLLNLFPNGQITERDLRVLGDRGVVRVATVFVRHDPVHACVFGGGDELALRAGCGHYGECDDEEIMSVQGGDDRLVGVIVDGLDSQAFWELGSALRAGEGGDGVLAACDEGFGDVGAYLTAALLAVSVIMEKMAQNAVHVPRLCCLLYTSPSPRDGLLSRMPSSA